MLMRVRDVTLSVLNLWTRMPFKYGIATLTAVPHLFVRVELEMDGRVTAGLASDNLPPKWFTKDADRSTDEELLELIEVARRAAQHAMAAAEMPSVFDLWRQVYAAQRQWGERTGLPPLLWAFGITLIERAVIDAYCRATRTTFADAVHSNVLGLRLGEIHPELEDAQPADLLPASPLRQVIVRHTVGLADPLTAADIPHDEQLDDGLPHALDQCIDAYGLTHFKIKIPFASEVAVDRLTRLAQMIGARCPSFAFTLDGNEFYHDIAAFRVLWERLKATLRIADFLARGLMFVEQPLHRDAALSETTSAAMHAWRDRPTMIIDESDGTLSAVRQALDAGYHGTSHKNCKGVFKGIASACLLEVRRRAGAAGLVMSCEDLTNVGPVALQQDLAVVATLGITHAERNGHHYFAGLSAMPADLQRVVLSAHGDLYRANTTPQGDTWPTLRIERGVIRTDSVIEAPFGYATSGGDLNVAQFTPVEAWRIESLAR
jgi:hypothetical protein